MTNKINLDSQFKQTLDLVENSTKHIFLTGNAGTGKSTLLEYWRNNTKKSIAILAPTGVAALNVKGQTIHSFFGFRPDITVQKVQRFYRNRGKKGLFKKLDAIVIDEISMVRADLLDCIDAFLRIHGKNHNLSFGGIKMIFIGDLHQLPPVVRSTEKEIFANYYKTPYFFSANVFENLDLEFVELKKIYRQSDEEFIKILDSIRNNNIDNNQLTLLNSRVDEQFETPANKFFITLTTTNKKTQAINEYHLGKIFSERFTYEGQGTGKFDVKSLPTSGQLEVKIGSQIMMVANDREGRWVNGSLGKINKIETDKTGGPDIIIVELSDGQEVEITPHTWEMFKVNYNPATDKLQTESVGSYKQYPLTLAWAITIHKSQGKTFENVIIDFGWGTFAHGQAYVALSRCTSLNGIILSKTFEKRHIITDEQVKKFLSTFKYLANSEKQLGDNSEIDSDTKFEALIEIIKKAIESETLLKFTDKDSEQRTVSPELLLLENERQMKAHCFTSDKIEIFDLSEINDLRELSGIS
jgi:ATP-dependent DNA helicase PIF1